MPPYPQLYVAGTNTAATDLTIPLSAGATSSTYSYDLWNDKGGAHSDTTTLVDARLRVQVLDGSQYLETGSPVVDEKWTRAQVTASIKTGDPTMSDQLTGELALGADSDIPLSDIPKNCARTLSVTIHAPSNVATGSVTLRFVLVFDEASLPLSRETSLALGSGVVPDRRVYGNRRLLRGRTLSASGAATVTVAKGSFAYDGAIITKLAATVTLNQTAADGALAGGQSYIAVLSQKSDGTVTTTKSNKGASPTTPSTPANEIYLGKVNVAYQGGGTSIINSGDLDTTGVVYGDYYCYAGTGLTLYIGAGQSLASTDLYAFQSSTQSISLTDNTTNYVWSRPDGTFSKSTTSTLPVAGAHLLATAVTAAGAISSVTDRRTMLDAAITDYVIELRKSGTIGAIATDYAWGSIPFDCYLDSVEMEMATIGSVSGSYKVDVFSMAAGTAIGGSRTTIYTNSGTSDQRPSLAYNATVLRTVNYDHEVNSFTAGTRFTGDIVAVTGTPNGTDLLVRLRFKRA